MQNLLVIHNTYQQRGGEDSVVEAEVELLRARGHRVFEYQRSNDELNALPRAQAAWETLWSARSAHDVAELIARERIELVHCHNTFPRVSPSVYWAAARAGVPLVQTLHNFRLVCPQALMLRDEQPCEDCVGRSVPWPAVRHACYRGSRAQSTVLAGMLVAHRVAGTWQRRVSRYIALNEFCRQRFIAGGLPAERIAVKPNFVDTGPAPDPAAPREGVLFVGRLSHEKGVAVLAEAAHRLGGTLPLTVVGSGPLAHLLEGLPGVRLLGAQPAQAVLAEMRRARLLVLPSICYENFPRTLAEAFACGLPVVASKLGAMAELVHDGETGAHFEAGNASDLAQVLAHLHGDPGRCAALGANARCNYENELTPAANYRQLISIYTAAQSADTHV